MARNRRSNRRTESNYQSRKDDRTYVAIVSKNKLVGVWTGEEDTSRFVPAPNDRDTRLGALELFSEVLDDIPTNDTLLDKQVAIYGINCLVDCFTKPGDIIRSKEVSEEAKEMIPELARKYFERSYNCFLVETRNSNATIVNEGFNWLQEASERLAAQAMGVTYEKKDANSAAPTEHKTPLQKLEDKLSDIQEQIIDCEDDEEMAKLESKMARIESMIEKEMARSSQSKAQA